jgi:hypothetical protein
VTDWYKIYEKLNTNSVQFKNDLEKYKKIEKKSQSRGQTGADNDGFRRYGNFGNQAPLFDNALYPGAGGLGKISPDDDAQK